MFESNRSELGRIESVLQGAALLSSSVPDRCQVMLVDADRSSNRSVLQTLALDGLDVETHHDAERALLRAAQWHPDLIILDLELPGLTGFEVATSLRDDARTRRIPILVVSARDDLRSRVAAYACGADCFLPKPFGADELRAAVASLAGRGRNLHDIESGAAVVASLVQVVMAMWGDARRHVRRSALLARCFGERLGLEPADCDALERAGWLHDIGKVGVPREILNKPGPLTTAEREVMQQHPLIGARICEPLESLAPVLPVILHHHEWFDGSGYPYGLAGESIPSLARVFQVADVYEALSSERCYKAAMSPDESLAVLDAESRAGKWDPRLVRSFCEFLRAGLLDDALASPSARDVTGS